MTRMNRSTVKRLLGPITAAAAAAVLFGCGSSTPTDTTTDTTATPPVTSATTTPPPANTSSLPADPTNEKRPEATYELPTSFPGAEPVHVAYNPFVLGAGSATGLTQ